MTGGTAATIRRLPRWLPWVLLVAVAVSALIVGSSRSNGRPNLDARVMHIAGEVRCPVCEGQSAAQSQTAASIQIRDQIREQLTSGKTEGQILAGLVRAYGPGILEKPQASGVSLVVWVVPVAAVVAALAGLILAFRRWRARIQSPAEPPTEEDRRLVDAALESLTAGSAGSRPPLVDGFPPGGPSSANVPPQVSDPAKEVRP